MSTMDKNEVLIELKKLQGYLQKRSDAEERIRQCEYDMNTLERRLAKETDIPLKPTDQCEKQRAAYTPNVYLSVRIIILFLVIGFIAVCALVYGICALFVKDDNWYDPNLLGIYEGYVYSQYSDPEEISFEFTSCDKKGKLEGIYRYGSGDSLREIEFWGNITQRDGKGYLFVTINYKENFSTAEVELLIYDDYNVIRGINRDLILYSPGHERPVLLEDLYTPELIKMYSGQFEPDQYNKVGIGDTKLTFESCDNEGNVAGVFEYVFEKGSAKWAFTGKINEKYSDGALRLSLDVTGELSGSDFRTYTPNKTMSVVIYDDYRSLSSSEGFEWIYSNGELESPPEKTRFESVATSAIVVVILVYPLLAFALFKILSNIKFEFLTRKQKKKLAELRKLDAENKKENQRNLARAKAMADVERKRVTSRCARESADAELQLAKYDNLVAEESILSPEDKNLHSVEFLIKQLESGRADTLKEALDKLDIHNENRKARFEQEMHQMQMNNMIRDAIAKAQSDQICHNFNVEQESRKQTRELEEIRKKLEE